MSRKRKHFPSLDQGIDKFYWIPGAPQEAVVLKIPHASAGDAERGRFDSWVRKMCPWGGNGHPFQCSGLWIPRTDERGGLQSAVWQRVRHDWSDSAGRWALVLTSNSILWSDLLVDENNLTLRFLATVQGSQRATNTFTSTFSCLGINWITHVCLKMKTRIVINCELWWMFKQGTKKIQTSQE